MSHGGDPKVVPLHDLARGRVGERSPTDPLYQVMVYRRAIREMSRGLSAPQRVLFLFLVDYISGWGLPEKLVTYRVIEAGDEIHCGTDIGVSQAKVHLAALEASGRIVKKRHRDGMVISINLAWEPSSQQQEQSMLARPKRLRAEKADASDGWAETRQPENRLSEGRKTGYQTAGNPAPFIEERLEDRLEERPSGSIASLSAGRREPTSGLLAVPRKRQRPASIPAPSAPAAAPSLSGSSALPPVAPAPLPSTNTRRAMPDLLTPLVPVSERRASLPFGGLEGKATRERHARWQIAKPGAVEKTFREAFEECFGQIEGAQCPAWTKEQLGMVKTSIIAKWRGDAESLHEFTDWCVREWLAIRAKTFGYRKKKPARVLGLGFWLAAREEFINAWNDRASLDWVRSLADPVRERYETLRQQGLTHDEAQTKIAEDRAANRLHDEIARGKAEASNALRAAQLVSQQTARRNLLARVDPRSEAARKAREAAAMPKAPALQPGSNPVDDFLSFKPGTFRED